MTSATGRPAATGTSRARFSSVAAPRLIASRYRRPSLVKRSISGTSPTVLIVIALAATDPPYGQRSKLGRGQHAVVVQERLAHPHEDGPGDPPALGAGHLARLDELIDDLPGRQVSPPWHPRRGAEDAAHRAADLRREANAHRPRLVQRDQHRLDRQAVVSRKSSF